MNGEIRRLAIALFLIYLVLKGLGEVALLTPLGIFLLLVLIALLGEAGEAVKEVVKK